MKKKHCYYIYTFQFGGFRDELATHVQYNHSDKDDENARVRWEIRRSSPIILTQSKPSLQLSQRREACEYFRSLGFSLSLALMHVDATLMTQVLT